MRQSRYFLIIRIIALSNRAIDPGKMSGEDVYAAMGRTDAGRYLIVFFIHKLGHLVFILSARDMDKKERRRYERR